VLNSKYEYFSFRREGNILFVTIDNGARHNRVDAAMHKELSRLFYEIGEDPESDVVVLSAAGRFFGVGGDLDYMRDQIADPNLFHRSVREAKRIIYSILECDKPTICRVHGDAIGLAATIALACDIVIADENASIIDPHVRVGLVAGDGGALLWPQLIGYARARYHLLTGRPLLAREAANSLEALRKLFAGPNPRLIPNFNVWRIRLWTSEWHMRPFPVALLITMKRSRLSVKSGLQPSSKVDRGRR
jgi:enoyl-CoA hydratase